jgi:hypothetical protein
VFGFLGKTIAVLCIAFSGVSESPRYSAHVRSEEIAIPS